MLRDEYYDLGGFGRPVTTASADAQAWFDRGLAWCYGFNHEEAVRCFRAGGRGRPAPARWRTGASPTRSGPNYNKDWEAFEPQELIDAVGRRAWRRHRRRRAGRRRHAGRAGADRGAARRASPRTRPPRTARRWSDAYAAAMRDVYAEFGDDPDVAALFAEALIGRTPWQLWDLQTGEPAEGADTAEAIDVLERAMAGSNGDRRTPACCTCTCTRWRCRPIPERALPAADQLRDLVPDAGHLRHMPTHIDVLCGHYRDVVTGNAARDRGRPQVPGARGRRSTSTPSTAATTTTSRSTARCSWASRSRRWRRPPSWRRR